MIPVARHLLAGLSLAALADEPPPLSRQVTGGDSEYIIQRGDSLIAIGARFGVAAKVLAQHNAIPYEAIIHPGQRLRIHNPHIVPAGLDDGILVNLPQRMLFLLSQGRLLAARPVGLGTPAWPTPESDFEIVSRVENKTWLVPKSIQEEMRREGKAVLEEVPPGPDNPLGKHWLGLSLWDYGIHGTIAPAAVQHVGINHRGRHVLVAQKQSNPLLRTVYIESDRWLPRAAGSVSPPCGNPNICNPR